MAIGRYITDAINQSITNERQSMANRFSQEINQRRYDEAMAYQDRGFAENVRQFQMGHALRQAAGDRAERALDSQLKTDEQLRDMRSDTHEHWENVVAPYERGSYARKSEAEKLLHSRLMSPEAQKLYDMQQDIELQKSEDTLSMMESPAYRRGVEIKPLIDYRDMVRTDKTNQYNFENLGKESPLDQARRLYIEKQTAQLGMTPYQKEYLNYLNESLKYGNSGDSGISFPQQRMITEDDQIIGYMQDLFEKGSRRFSTPLHGSFWTEMSDPQREGIFWNIPKWHSEDENYPSQVDNIRHVGSEMANLLSEQMGNNDLIAVNNLNRVFNNFVMSEQGQRMVRRWEKALPNHSREDVITKAKQEFVIGGQMALLRKRIDAQSGQTPAQKLLKTPVQ